MCGEATHGESKHTLSCSVVTHSTAQHTYIYIYISLCACSFKKGKKERKKAEKIK